MVRYLKRPYSSIVEPRARPRVAAAGASVRNGVGSRRLQRALGQDVGDRALLDPDAHVVGDLDGDEVLADLADRAGDAAVGDHLVAVAELVEHGPMLLLPLHLRADHQEVHHRDQDDREQQAAEAAAEETAGSGLAGRLGHGGRDDQVDRIHLDWVRVAKITGNYAMGRATGPAAPGPSPARAAWKDRRKSPKVPEAMASRIPAINRW